MTAHRLPVLGFIGIHAGRHTDRPVSQNETLAQLLGREGYRVHRASAIRWPPLRTLHQILALLAWRDIDAVVVAVFSGPSFWIADFSSFIARKVYRRKVILYLHGGNLPVFGPAHRRRVTRAFDRADLILAPSSFLADVFRPWGYDVRIIPNVLAIDNYRYVPRTEARPALMWMRTFHEHYDPVMAVEVLHRVRQVHPTTTMTMGGADQGLLDETVAKVAELGLTDAVTFAGYMTGAAKADAFADHDIFLNTNVVDNMPVSVLEASACGLVPVATSVGGIPALLTDGVDSRLVPAGDADAMAAVVIELLDHPETFAALSVGARILAERSGWRSVHQMWSEQFRILLPEVSMG